MVNNRITIGISWVDLFIHRTTGIFPITSRGKLKDKRWTYHHLFERQIYKERNNSLHPLLSSLKCIEQPELGWSKDRSPELHLSSLWDYHPPLPSPAISQELYQKWSNWDPNQHSHEITGTTDGGSANYTMEPAPYILILFLMSNLALGSRITCKEFGREVVFELGSIWF